MKKPVFTRLHLFLFLFPVLVACFFAGWRYFTISEISLSSTENSSTVIAYSDANLKGLSDAQVIRDNEDWIFTYTLRKGYEWPYAGVCFIPRNGRMIGVGESLELYLSIEANKAKTIPILINEYMPGFAEIIHLC